MTIEDVTKRHSLIEKILPKYIECAHSIILTGSMAYGDAEKITSASDIDLLLVSENVKRTLSTINPNLIKEKRLDAWYFDGFCLSTEHDGIKLSLHLMSKKTLNLIALMFVGNLRVFRQNSKNSAYMLSNFLGGKKEYVIKNIGLSNGSYRTIVPVSFIEKDTYHIGVYKEKLLCAPQVLHDTNNFARDMIDLNWDTITQIFQSEQNRFGENVSFTKGLLKYENFSLEAKKYVETRLATCF